MCEPLTPEPRPMVIAGYCLACVLDNALTAVEADGYCSHCQRQGYYLPPDHDAVEELAYGS